MSEVEIRFATLEDAQRLCEIYNYYIEHTAITFEIDTLSIEEFRNRIADISKVYPYFVAYEGDEILGYAYATRFHPRAAYDWCVEVAIYLDHTQKGRGIGSKLYYELEKFLKAQNVLNVYACIAYTDEEDEYLTNGSMKFHESYGFNLNGKFKKCGYKFGKWYDMIWMEKFLKHHPKTPKRLEGVEDLIF